MTSTEEVTFDAPAPKKKAAAKKHKPAKRAATAGPKSTAPFPGLTRAMCADACGAKGCAIGTSYCSHPCKGGLQAPDMSNPVLLKNIQKARVQIDVRLDPDRFK